MKRARERPVFGNRREDPRASPRSRSAGASVSVVRDGPRNLLLHITREGRHEVPFDFVCAAMGWAADHRGPFGYSSPSSPAGVSSGVRIRMLRYMRTR